RMSHMNNEIHDTDLPLLIDVDKHRLTLYNFCNFGLRNNDMALDLNELRREQTRLESQGNNNFLDNFVRMPEGDGIVVVRILPPRKGQKLYCVTRTHKLGQKNFHCPQTLVNG